MESLETPEATPTGVGNGLSTGMWHVDSHDDHARHGHQASLEDALDFVNTYEFDKGDGHDHLTDIPTAVEWLQKH